MTHPHEALSAYLDGETGPEESAVVVQHLGECAACRVEMGTLVESRRAIRSLPILEPPADLVSGPAVPPSRPSLRVMVGTAAAVLALVSAIALGSTDTVTVDELVVPHVELARGGAMAP